VSEITKFSQPDDRAAHSSETSAQIIILHGVISQKTAISITPAVKA